VKPSESTSKHYAHCALEVWSVLYPTKPFGVKNTNIISYSIAAMLYAKLKLKKKVDWRTLFTKKKNDRADYGQRDVPDNFSTASIDAKVGVVVTVLATNPSSSKPIEVSTTKFLRESGMP
jgi:hypothetical protein